MGSVYALLIGIDAYPNNPLRGCVADIEHAASYLEMAAPRGRLHRRTLRDDEATRANIIAGIRSHLAQAGPDDTALLWYAGHGATCAVWPQYVMTEPGGTMQALVCHDSTPEGVPVLLDKELEILLGEVAARRGHIVTVFDCCHATGMTRTDVAPFAVRGLTTMYPAPDIDRLLPEFRSALVSHARDGLAPTTSDPAHVALHACATAQKAYEVMDGDQVRGAFSSALLGALAHMGGASCRELLADARCRVENRVGGQTPTLFPIDQPIADQPFLGGGATRSATSPATMRFIDGRWEINAGAVHGLVPGRYGDGARVAVLGSQPVLEAAVDAVGATTSTVTPMGWTPDDARQYPVVLTQLPVPPVAVAFGGVDTRTHEVVIGPNATGPDADKTVRLLREALGGRPGTPLRLVDADETAPDIVLTFPRSDAAQPLALGGSPYLPPFDVYDAGTAAAFAARLDHLARWLRLRGLDNPVSRISHAVRIEIVPIGADESAQSTGLTSTHPAVHAAALPPDASGAVVLRYRLEPGGWRHPMVRIRLRNTSDRPLYCALLDLTDSYRVHSSLFSGDVIAPRHAGWADRGRPIKFELPRERPIAPGASVTDHLKLIVCEQEFDSRLFSLPAIGEAVTRDSLPMSVGRMVGRLAVGRTTRDAVVETGVDGAADWATGMMTVVTSVPSRP